MRQKPQPDRGPVKSHLPYSPSVVIVEPVSDAQYACEQSGPVEVEEGLNIQNELRGRCMPQETVEQHGTSLRRQGGELSV